jgi:hypothetical protein
MDNLNISQLITCQLSAKIFARVKASAQHLFYSRKNVEIEVIQGLYSSMAERLGPRSKGEGDARKKTSGGRLSQGKMGWSNAMVRPNQVGARQRRWDFKGSKRRKG